jgi:CheY-like chemotaxis protein
LRKPTGEFTSATALDQDQSNIDLPNSSLLAAAAKANGKPVTGRMEVGEKTYTLAAKALPNVSKEQASGPVPVAATGEPVAILVRGTPETALNDLLKRSLLQELAVFLLALLVVVLLALEVDRLVTEQELVIKPFGAALKPPSYIYGCTILGDGGLIPVIDGAALLNSFMGQTKTATFSTTLSETPTSDLKEHSSTASITAPPLQTAKASTILVVDDSITLRQTLVLTFEKAGYQVLQARDGREAIEQLQQNLTIQLVVCDIEMPIMNGFEFLSQRRTDPQLAKIPTVMLTSRSSDKHRQLAMHLGANGYFTKPYIEQEFLAALETVIRQDAPAGVPALVQSR